MNGSLPIVVLVVEKPHAAKVLAPYLAKRWPGHRIVLVFTLYLGLYEFSYPRGLTADDFPYVAEPRWKQRAVDSRVVWEVLGDEAVPSQLTVHQALTEAQTIQFTCDPDASGAIAWRVLLENVLGKDEAAHPRPVFCLTDYSAGSIEQALDHPRIASTAESTFETWLHAGMARKFFDFNFNVNALALFGAALRQTSPVAAHGSHTVGMSKYGLQFLYFTRACERGHVDQQPDIRAMQQWKGTGRYQDEPCMLGSPASQGQILQNLAQLGLIREVRLPHPGRSVIQLTEAGHRFLDLLHPDCEDADLPFRLRQWGTSWPDSREAIERYLRTFFGKQKRFGGLS